MPRFLALAALLAGCAGCLAKDAPAKEELQLRSYKVPEGAGQRLRAVIHSVLFLERDRSVGRVSLSPDGQLVVLGSPEVQKGVAALVRDFSPSHSVQPTVELTYWILRGHPGAAKDAPELADIAPALKAIAGQGAGQLELIEKLRLSSLSDEAVQIKGRDVEVRQTASLLDGHITADLRVMKRHNQVETRVRLDPGQILVLAQSGESEQPGVSLYYVVRAAAAERK